ncbi:polysaccharide biosynthesis tyrosine autokinase [Tautonia plasticadhaerens]|uniref:Tyrosine-protein kinase ptk n=1 Tax=Tautonia plasticadhaerens TaxID=2527974 RepID=A0A518HFS8_9BACT|nr:polysaccharide biosynthesis tyrosine autokinase [Tautonia plasticadhaerens]QDV39693.1 Tyrosine-protein kinase ptk [Tautonia plasticadhaerens]
MPALLRALRLRWKLAVSGAILLGAAAGAVAFVAMPPAEYSSRSLVHVAEKRPRDLFETRESGVSYAIYQHTQTTLIRSNKVLEAALKKSGIGSLEMVRSRTDPVAWLRERLRTEFGNSEILTISMSGGNPEAVATVVNAVTEAYLEQIVRQEEQERVERLERLEQLFEKYQEELRAKREDYREQAQSAGASDQKGSALRQQMVAEHLGQSRRELVQLQSEIRKARAEVTVLAEDAATPAAAAHRDLGFEGLIGRDPVVAKLRADLAEYSGRLEQVRRIVRNPGEPSRKRLEQAVASLAESLRMRYEELRGFHGAQQSGDRPAARDPGLEQAGRYLEILEEQERILREEIASLEQEMGTLGIQSLDLHWVEDEIDLSTEVARAVGSEVRAVTVELEAPPRIRLLEPAKPQGPADPMERYKFCAMAAVASMGAFVGLVSLWEFRAQRIDATAEVAGRLGIGVVGALPTSPRGDRGGATAVRRRALIESVDAVRTALLRASQVEPLQVIMVTSATKGEGKSSLSCHLATSLARAGRRTLLLDCDLRSPAIHLLMDEPLAPGLCEVLRGEVALDDAVHATAASPLEVLPAGCCDAAAVDALAREEFPRLIQDLRGRYEFIIVDSAPALIVTDTLMLSQHVDAALLSVLRLVSRAPDVGEAYERLATLGVRILGAVVSGVRDDPNLSDDRYHYLSGVKR